MIRASVSVHQVSHDGYVRLRCIELYRTKFEHLYSEVHVSDAPGSDRKSGLTEWVADHGGLVLSIAWDWQTLDDGVRVVDLTTPISTNIMLVCEKGYDMGTQQTQRVVREHIEGMRWANELECPLLQPDGGHLLDFTRSEPAYSC